MGECYCGMAPNAPDVCANGPAGWNPLWSFPGPPWAPGWPVGIETGFSLGLTLGTVSIGAAVNLIANALFNGIDDSTLQCHSMQITGLINGATLQLSTDGVNFFNALANTVRNYTGAKYGFNQNLYLNLNSGNVGQSGSITVTITSTNPVVTATVNFTVAAGYTLAAISVDGTHQVQVYDGSQWIVETTPSFGGRTPQAICWSPDLALYCAVGGSGLIFTSPDGITWTIQTSPVASGWTSVCWSSGKSLFVAVSANSTVITSPDGVNWTQRTFSFTGSMTGVCWSPDVSLFVAVAADASTNKIFTSPDGVTWTQRTSAMGRWDSVCWSHELSKFVIVGFNNVVGTSPDGVTWTLTSMLGAAQVFFSMCWNGSVFVAVGTGVAASSPDGTTWTQQTPAEANTWASVCWSPSLSLFVAVSSNGTHRVMTSPDGVTWSTQSLAEQNSMHGICAKS